MAINELKLYCDALVEPVNPGGWGCWAWVAVGPTGKRLREEYGCHGHGAGITNNLLEYVAILHALRYTATRAEMLKAREIVVLIYSDSQLAICQLLGKWACNSPHLVALRDEITAIASALRADGVDVRFEWIPREQNMDADALTWQAYREARASREAA